MFRKLFFKLIVCVVVVTCEVYERERERQHAFLRLDRNCDLGFCFPTSGDLLIGRETRLFATSTCGTYGPEKYYDIKDLKRKTYFWCDSNNSINSTIDNFQLNHIIQNVIHKYSGTRGESWWQSENGKENVSIQLDLEVGFLLKQLIIQFKSFRPKAMLLEVSSDFGKTWRVYRYFAYNCTEAFPEIRPTSYLTEAVCESQYPGIMPSPGIVNFRLVPFGVSSKESQSFLNSTNLRINFTKLHTLASHGDISDNRASIRDKYYAIKKMIVLGSCFCNGHAARCVPLSGTISNDNIVYGRCKCAHNTFGLHCERCDNLFNDLPWQPAAGKNVNECKNCNCNNHATKCHFDQEVYNKSGQLRGGICDDCQHNTMGIHCERCRPKFYQDHDLDIQDPYICKACNCNLQGVTDQNIICDAATDYLKNKTAGRCLCKLNVGGMRCNRCRNGFWNLDNNNPDGCEKCTCNILGTVDNQSCDTSNGMCFCKRHVTGRNCDQCLPEFYGLSDSENGCSPCDCNPSGALDVKCDFNTGQCKCRPNITGRRCDHHL